MKLHFISFIGEYSTPSKFSKAKDALLPMIQNMNIFDTITIINQDELLQDPEFAKHIPFIIQNRRGFGYWIWKPYVILKKMQEIEEGDMIFYADICTSIRVEGKERFLEYIESAKSNKYGNLFFPYSHPQYPRICDWCKMDTIKALDAENIMNQPEVIPGILFITVNGLNKKLFLDWYNIMHNYHLVDDTPSTSQNVSTFREHRHDQSIFSILIRKYYPQCVTDKYVNEVYFNDRKEQGQTYPIWIQSNHY